MTLIIEDGSIVTGADSYASLAVLRAYALKRGVTLSAVDADLEVLAIKAMDYLGSFEQRYQSERTDATTQPLSFPRKDIVINDALLGDNDMPQNIIDAQCEVVMYLTDSFKMFATPDEGGTAPLKRKKIDVLEFEYDTARGSTGQAVFPRVDAKLTPLLRTGGPLTSVRV